LAEVSAAESSLCGERVRFVFEEVAEARSVFVRRLSHCFINCKSCQRQTVVETTFTVWR
jgi:hypothetical protein